ncbi:MAG: LysM peptidoglycan-binding domain-containing protein [Rhodocyclaceae bacterium]|nr:LysM peptidoglycan-binding domain-containing protein [Rhodocyclaceae bacterium]
MRKIIFNARASKKPVSATAITTLAAALAASFTVVVASPVLAQTVAEPKPVKLVSASSLKLAPGAPDRYMVVSGDTLWSLASKFLKDPYRWNELFKQNKDTIKNPNLIYPGQVLVLDRNGPSLGIETVKLEPREYAESLKKELWTVSPEAIAPFLSKPLVIEPGPWMLPHASLAFRTTASLQVPVITFTSPMSCKHSAIGRSSVWANR